MAPKTVGIRVSRPCRIPDAFRVVLTNKDVGRLWDASEFHRMWFMHWGENGDPEQASIHITQDREYCLEALSMAKAAWPKTNESKLMTPFMLPRLSYRVNISFGRRLFVAGVILSNVYRTRFT